MASLKIFTRSKSLMANRSIAKTSREGLPALSSIVHLGSFSRISFLGFEFGFGDGLLQVLGSGGFGAVYRGTYRGEEAGGTVQGLSCS